MLKFLKTLILALLITFSIPATARVPNQQIDCLARSIYFEAGNQPKMGKIAVSNVVMNRMRDGRFGSSPCAVISQRKHGKCQFSWMCAKPIIRDRKLYVDSVAVARDTYLGNAVDVTNGALYFNTVPFRGNMILSKRIGHLLFYKERV